MVVRRSTIFLVSLVDDCVVKVEFYCSGEIWAKIL